MNACTSVARDYLCLMCCLTTLSLAQTLTTARFVHDATGAAIIRAEITAQNRVTGEKKSTQTDGSGDYVLTSISPGTYEVTISAPGFSMARYTSVQAEIGGTVTINAVLTVATAASQVTVSDAPQLMQSSNAEIGISIDATTVSAMPLPTRNFLQLAAITPGVSMPLTDNSAIGRNSPNFSVNGARTSQNNLRINGIDANDISAHDFASVAIPAPESISEIVVKTSMYDASVSGAGASIQLITKAGTNSLHGASYEYWRDTALNANDPNLKAVELSRPVLRRSVYGATLGGPIRKNRAFFFVSYQGTRETNVWYVEGAVPVTRPSSCGVGIRKRPSGSFAFSSASAVGSIEVVPGGRMGRKSFSSALSERSVQPTRACTRVC